MVDNFKIVTLNTIAKITRLAGYEYSSYWEEDPNGKIIALRGYNIGKNRLVLNDIARITNELSLKLKRSRLSKGDVIYPCVGTIGNAAVIEIDDKFHIQQNIARIIPDGNKVNPYYLAYYLMSDKGLDEIKRFNGTSSQPNVLVGSLRQYNIILPDTGNQQAIAEALSDVDNLNLSLEKLIEKKKAIKQGTMQELLTGKKRLDGFEGEWKKNKLKYYINEFIVPMRDKPKDLTGNIPWCRIEDFCGKYLFKSKTSQGVSIKTIEEMNLKVFPVNTLLVSCSANLGRCAIIKRALITNQTFIGLVPGNLVDVEFLFYYMQSESEKLNNLSSGTTISYLSREEFEEYEVYFPGIDEQRNIAMILSAMDLEISKFESKLKKYKKIKQGMMQELLTGRIRLV